MKIIVQTKYSIVVTETAQIVELMCEIDYKTSWNFLSIFVRLQ